jgi:uncharacterized protein (DUF1501 family)
MSNLSKRGFLRTAAAAPLAASSLAHGSFGLGLAGLAALAAQAPARAATGDTYRALVCLFMAGGNDAHNWVVPTDSTGHGEYLRARGSLAMPVSNLRTLSAAPRQSNGRQFGFAADLDPMRELYESGQLAVLANVGTLQQPTTKADYLAGRGLPPKLFSHNDQQSWWQSLAPEGARSGWGGRIADAVMAQNGAPIFTSVSACGNSILLAGNHGQQYQIGTTGAVPIRPLNEPATLGSPTVAAVLRRSMARARSDLMQTGYSNVVKRSAEAYEVLAQAVSQVNVASLRSPAVTLSDNSSFTLENSPVAKQLRAVAQMIAARGPLGMRRQVFMVQIGGFDTHGNLMRDQPALMASVAQSIAWFTATMREQGLEDSVTLFTASDFGRTLTSNGSGSDHGWGSHHFIAGGAVRGRDIYGRFPVTSLGTPEDVGSGRMLPTTSVTEYAATLARWMGVSSADLTTVLPNIGEFGNSDLGFL